MKEIKLPDFVHSKNITGQRFGKLVAIKRTLERDRGSMVWECLCDCGKIKNVPYSRLKSSHTQSCGCIKINRQTGIRPKNTLTMGEASLRFLYCSYRWNSKKRGFSFNLSLDEFRQLTKQNCYYCRVIPKQVLHYFGCNGDYVYNGIDRVDNSIGYTLENCVPCCKTCNSAKGSLTQEEFRKWVINIYNNFIQGDNDE